MREIKFRAWWYDHYADLVDGTYMGKWKLSTVHSLHTGTGKVIVTGGFSSSARSIPIGDDCVIEQFTGLLDKNGKEIYEGDIVRACIDYGPGGEGWHVYAVEITPHGANLEPWTFKEPGYLPEVIGNIHENGDLLK